MRAFGSQSWPSSQIQGERGGAPHLCFTLVSDTHHPVQSPHLSGSDVAAALWGRQS